MTRHIEKYMLVSAILGPRPKRITYWVTSGEWQEVTAEIEELGLVDKDKPAPAPAKRGLNDYIYIRANLQVVNAGTDDQRLVNAMNWTECPEDFAWRRDSLRVG